MQKMWKIGRRYDKINVLSYRYLATGGGDYMSEIMSFIAAVAAGVACHYIIKWLDSWHNKDNE